jgi:septal ring factor EnvC (AmiA/AmiB activator)
MLIGACLSGPAIAQTGDPETEAERVERELETERDRTRALEDRARTLSAELEELRLQLVTVAQDTQERESLITNLEIQIEELAQETEQRRAVLKERYRQLTGTLSALTGLSADAPRAFFLYPGSPLEAVRGSILLQAAAPAIGRRAAILREDLAALEAVRADLREKRDRLDRQDAALEQDRAQLETLLEKKRALYRQTAEQSEAANRRLRELTERAETLRDLLAALEAERIEREVEEAARLTAEREAEAAAATLDGADAPPPEAPPVEEAGAAELAALAALPTQRPDGIRPFPEDGAIGAPVTGRVVQRYGQDLGFGQTSKGLIVETRPGSAVLAPYDGKVVFAGPFRDLGRVLIIEHDGGYHSVLAGFGRIDVASGHWILAGEPIGKVAPAGGTGSDGSVVPAATGGSEAPRLYIELRRGGQPINPLRWITAGSIRVNG